MKKAFFAPAKYKMALPGDVPGVDGGLIFPSGIMSGALLRRDLSKKYPHLQRRLLDPQLYLAELAPSLCRTACANLASYEWFGATKVADYESGSHTQAEWKNDLKANIHKHWPAAVPSGVRNIHNAVSACVNFQRQLKCEGIILPSPLTTDLSSNYSRELGWLDAGLEHAIDLAPDSPAYPTIAISDTALRGIEPYSNALMSVIIDQITARAPAGVYIVIEQANEQGYYCGHPNTIGSLLRLVSEIKSGGVERVIVAPIGMAGLLALAAGADTWSTGWYRGERRIKLADFTDQTGMAVPTYYAQKLASEIHLQSDLDRINKAGLLKFVADVTPASGDLIRALRAGHSVDSVPEWQYRRSNVAAACEHFLRVAVRETGEFSKLTLAEESKNCLLWLREAEVIAARLYSVGSFSPRTELNHQTVWVKTFDSFTQRA